MKKRKLNEAVISVNGQEIKGLENPSHMSDDTYTITIEREWNDIYVTVKDSRGNEKGDQERIEILKDILPRVLNKLSED